MAWVERFCRADAAGGGDGTTDTNSGVNGAWTLAEAITNVAAGQRINVRAGTYANTTTARTFAGAGTTTAPVWWRGFNASAGDLDADAATAKPLLTFTTGLATFGGTHQIFSNLSIQGANTGRQLAVSGTSIKVDRVRVENTNAAAGSVAVANSANGNTFSRCWFKATSTAARVFQNTAASFHEGCVYTGGGVGIDSTAALTLIGCIMRACGSHGFQAITTAAIHHLVGCTFRGCGGDGIRLDVLPTTYCVIANCLFAGNGGWGINNASGANTNVVLRLGNDFWSNTSGTETGFGDSPSLSGLTESSDPHTSSSNLSLVSGALAKAGGQPGLLEGESYTSYLDVGAVQRQEPAASGGGISKSRLIGAT